MRRVCSSRASTTRRAGGISTERCPGRHRVLFFAWENSVLKVSKRSNIRWARGLKSGRSPVNEQAIGYRRPRNSSSGIPAWKRIAWSLKALTTFSPVVLGSFIYGVACVQGYGDFNKNRLAESSGYLDMPRDRLLNVCQSFFPGKGPYSGDEYRAIDPSSGGLSTALYGRYADQLPSTGGTMWIATVTPSVPGEAGSPLTPMSTAIPDYRTLLALAPSSDGVGAGAGSSPVSPPAVDRGGYRHGGKGPGRGQAPISANFIDNYLPADGAPYYVGTKEGRAG